MVGLQGSTIHYSKSESLFKTCNLLQSSLAAVTDFAQEEAFKSLILNYIMAATLRYVAEVAIL